MKINLLVSFKRDNGTDLFAPINSGVKPTFTEAKAAVAAALASQVAAAQEIVDAGTLLDT